MGATRWLKLRAGARKGTDAKTVTRRLDLARMGENRGNLGRAIPGTYPISSKISRRRPLDTGGPHKGNDWARGTGRSSSQSE